MIRFNKSKKQRGILIIDLMIGLLMSSVTILALFGIYSKFEGDKRAAVQVNNTLSDLYFALDPIKNTTQMVGWSIPFGDELNCNVYGQNATMGNSFSFNLLPLKINPGSNVLNSDDMTLIVGGSNYVFSPLKLTAPFFKASTNLSLEKVPPNFYVDNSSNNIPAKEFGILFETNKKCNLNEYKIYNNTITRPNNGYEASLQQNFSLNPNGGLTNGEDYSIGSSFFLFGKDFKVIKFHQENNQLKMSDVINGKNTVIADNIILLKLRYGLDTDNNGTIDSFSNSFTDFKQVKALKVGVLGKSPIKEKKKNNECIVTKNNIIKFGDENIDISNISNDQDWACYRYRFVSTEIELRNLRWLP